MAGYEMEAQLCHPQMACSAITQHQVIKDELGFYGFAMNYILTTWHSCIFTINRVCVFYGQHVTRTPTFGTSLSSGAAS